MASPDPPYDIFLSYSHDESEWVKSSLYDRLLQYQLKETGRRPRIFLDNSPDGIRVGQNWMGTIGSAIERSPRFVAVYSPGYFNSPVCMFELDLAKHTDV